MTKKKRTLKYQLGEFSGEAICWTPTIITIKDTGVWNLVLSWGVYVMQFWFERTNKESDIAKNKTEA